MSTEQHTYIVVITIDGTERREIVWARTKAEAYKQARAQFPDLPHDAIVVR